MSGLIRAVVARSDGGLECFRHRGGVALTARLGQPHRGANDVDTVVHPGAIETLLALPDPDGLNWASKPLLLGRMLHRALEPHCFAITRRP
jgi:hypothetical protein